MKLIRMVGALALALVLAVLLTPIVAELAAQVAGPLPGAVPPSGAINWAAAIALGAAGSVLTKGITWTADWADERAGRLDDGIRRKLGPTFPLVAGVFGMVLAPIAAKIGWHVTAEDVSAVQAFPAMAISGVVVREAARKWLLPALGIR